MNDTDQARLDADFGRGSTADGKKTCSCPTTPWRYDDPEPGPSQDCPKHGDPNVLGLAMDLFADPAPTAGGLDNSPGPWFIAGFNGDCARGCAGIEEGEQARAVGDGSGEFECRACVETERTDSDGPGFGYWSEGDL
jgi:hypothetical protein